MKICKKCGETKPLSEYYKHAQMADGHLNICKDCKRADAINVRNANIDYYRAYDQSRANNPERVKAREDYAKSAAGIESQSLAKKRFSKRNPVARKCSGAVNNAVKNGLLIKQPCEVCGSTGLVHGHHDDYSKPLDVRWLCPKHHAEWHKHNEPINRNG